MSERPSMTEPLRLLDGAGDDVEIALLRAAEAPPPAGARERATALVEQRLAGALLSAEAGRAAATRSRWTWLGWSTVGVTMIVAGLFAVGRSTTDVPPAKGKLDTPSIASSVASARDDVAPTAAASSVQETLPPAIAPRASATAPRVSAIAPRPVAREPSSPPSSSTSPTTEPPVNLLAEEVAAIDGVRSALRDGDTARAQRALDAYQQRFPRGVLAPEATLLRVETLLAAGDDVAARQLGERFIEGNASGAYVGRMRSLLQKRGASHSP